MPNLLVEGILGSTSLKELPWDTVAIAPSAVGKVANEAPTASLPETVTAGVSRSVNKTDMFVPVTLSLLSLGRAYLLYRLTPAVFLVG